MKKLLLLLAAVGMAVVSGCSYTGMTSDTTGKVYLTRMNLNGLWNSAYICEPNGGKMNCQEATFEGTGGGAAPAEGGGEAAPPPEPAPEEGGGEGEGEEGGEGGGGME